MSKLESLIQQLAGTHNKDVFKLMYGHVVSVDLDNENYPCCVVQCAGDYQVPNVALAAAVSDGFFRVPTVGSTVGIFKNIHGDGAYVTLFSDIDIIYMQTQAGWLNVWDSNNEPQNLQSKSYGGLVKLVDPNDQTVGLLAKINQLEKTVNNLITSFNAHLHISGAPTVNTSAPNVPFTSSITPITQRTDLENPNISHGV